MLEIGQEKTIQNIEGFDKSKLKHAETAEKVVPPLQSNFIFFVGLKTVVVTSCITNIRGKRCCFLWSKLNDAYNVNSAQ